MKRLLAILCTSFIFYTASAAANPLKDSVPPEKGSFRKTHTGVEDNFIRRKIRQQGLYKKPVLLGNNTNRRTTPPAKTLPNKSE